jgi:hypothetical membrane protein
VRLNLLSTLVGIGLFVAGVAVALEPGWAMVCVGVALVLIGLFRDDGKEHRP